MIRRQPFKHYRFPGAAILLAGVGIADIRYLIEMSEIFWKNVA